MRVVFIGCVQSSAALLESLINVPDLEIVGVVTRDKSKFNSDFVSLVDIASEHDLDCLSVDRSGKSEVLAWIQSKQPDWLYCFGWSQLLPNSWLEVPKKGSVGFHPAPLPENRGRHPIIWTLALGLTKTASTFFELEEEADAGAILSQEPVEVSDTDDASTLYDKILKTSKRQIVDLTRDLMTNSVKRISQQGLASNHWRKRSKQDGEIDWRMSSHSIYNLVRALTHPYVGAHFTVEGREYKVWKVKRSSAGRPNIEPGKILARESGTITVQCAEGAIEMVDFEDNQDWKVGEYL